MYRLSETTSPPKRSRRPHLPALHVIISNLRITFHRCLSDIKQWSGCDVDRLGGLIVSDTLYSGGHPDSMLFLCGRITSITSHHQRELMQWRERSGVSLGWFHSSVRVTVFDRK
ncbi:hypothetical protein Y032_0025g1167 [Ancylostoma ceylanicum]|uniref:Uncharacterized protein n=1 Tax=Ancylostoma ceylanicum TaxID=53326 RepID=A0A016UVS9_9BILA|nr:hypothetical protein Y032_0025g1167 [Ancylostoma ceylanicum]